MCYPLQHLTNAASADNQQQMSIDGLTWQVWKSIARQFECPVNAEANPIWAAGAIRAVMGLSEKHFDWRSLGCTHDHSLSRHDRAETCHHLPKIFPQLSCNCRLFWNFGERF